MGIYGYFRNLFKRAFIDGIEDGMLEVTLWRPDDEEPTEELPPAETPPAELPHGRGVRQLGNGKTRGVRTK